MKYTAKARALVLLRDYPDRFSLRDIEKMTGIPHQTLSVWARLDMSVPARAERRMASAHNRLLSVKKERILAGFVFYASLLGYNTSTARVQVVASRLFNVYLPDYWFPRWKKTYHLSSQRIRRITSAEFDESKFKAGMNLIKKIRSLALNPSQLYAIDKKMIKVKRGSGLQIAPAGLCASSFFPLAL